MHVDVSWAKATGSRTQLQGRPEMDPQKIIVQCMDVEGEILKNFSRAVYEQEWKHHRRQELLKNMQVLDQGPGRVDEDMEEDIDDTAFTMKFIDIVATWRCYVARQSSAASSGAASWIRHKWQRSSEGAGKAFKEVSWSILCSGVNRIYARIVEGFEHIGRYDVFLVEAVVLEKAKYGPGYHHGKRRGSN